MFFSERLRHCLAIQKRTYSFANTTVRTRIEINLLVIIREPKLRGENVFSAKKRNANRPHEDLWTYTLALNSGMFAVSIFHIEVACCRISKCQRLENFQFGKFWNAACYNSARAFFLAVSLIVFALRSKLTYKTKTQPYGVYLHIAGVCTHPSPWKKPQPPLGGENMSHHKLPFTRMTDCLLN